MTENEQGEKEALPLDLYMQHRQLLQQTMHDQARSFDKGILTLSSGALGLSIVFIERLAPHPVWWSKWFLAASWLLFAVAILLTLCSFLTSQVTHRSLIAAWDATRLNQADPETTTRDRFDLLTRWLNLASALLFFLGVLALVVFAIANLVKE